MPGNSSWFFKGKGSRFYLQIGGAKIIICSGKIYSPIYGEKGASDFYKTLAEDTLNSELKLNEIFENANTGNVALYIEYTWTVKSGKIVVFDVVDIIEFDDQNKILELKIIYDTVVSRNLVEEMKK